MGQDFMAFIQPTQDCSELLGAQLQTQAIESLFGREVGLTAFEPVERGLDLGSLFERNTGG
jgi:hypothetical protein